MLPARPSLAAEGPRAPSAAATPVRGQLSATPGGRWLRKQSLGSVTLYRLPANGVAQSGVHCKDVCECAFVFLKRAGFSMRHFLLLN